LEEFSRRRKHPRIPYGGAISFTVLHMVDSDFRRVGSYGKILDASTAGLGIETPFPLETGHILQWDDEHKEGQAAYSDGQMVKKAQ